MEKLRKLLQYYEDERKEMNPCIKKIDYWNNKAVKDNMLRIISLDYWFITRAYWHKHIDWYRYTDARHCMYKVSGTYPHWKPVDIVHNIIMVLSCEDEPLDFLIDSLQ